MSGISRMGHGARVRSVTAGLAVAFLIGALVAPGVSAAAPYPAAGTAVVDGAAGEWTAGDHFADMTDNGAPGDVLATLSLRYDCATETLFALVMATGDGQVRQDRPDEAYLRIDGSTKIVQGNSGNDGTPPDFAWVGGDGTLADGFEASAPLAPGAYVLRGHVLLAWDDSDGYLTLDTVPRDTELIVECAEPTPEPTPAPTEEPTEEPTPAPTEEPTEEPTPAPTEEPTGSAAPIEGTPEPTQTPGGGVEGATGTPQVTLPPTDAVAAPPADGSSGLRLVFLGLAALFGAIALLTPAPARAGAGARDRR